MSHTRNLAVALVACAVAAPAAIAGVWNEQGDAGQLMSNAQMISGEPGFLTDIYGNLGPNGDADLYKICLDQPADFSIIAYSTVGGPSPILFLFDEFGNGIKYAASADPLQPSWFDNLMIPGAGPYYLGVASRDAVAQDGGGDAIWNQGTGGQFAPNGPGANGELSQWIFTEGITQGDYRLEVRGVDYFPLVPAPGALALLGFAAFGRTRRR